MKQQQKAFLPILILSLMLLWPTICMTCSYTWVSMIVVAFLLFSHSIGKHITGS